MLPEAQAVLPSLDIPDPVLLLPFVVVKLFLEDYVGVVVLITALHLAENDTDRHRREAGREAAEAGRELGEPALDEQDFERYVKSLFPLMVAGRDVLWVLGGRTDTNRGKCCTFATT